MRLIDGLLGDAELAAVTGAEAALAAMARVEAALARAQARLGVIPADAGERIARVAESLRPDPAQIALESVKAGIPAQPFVAALRRACGEDAAYVHFGATSQDVQDSAFALQAREALALIEARLDALDATLARKALDYADTPIAARTRFQIAAPTTLGAKIAVWRAPLVRHRERLAQLRPRLLVLSLHGAAGTSAALGPRAQETRRLVGEALGLGVVETPWHASRDAIVELGGWLAMATGTLGKFGLDLIFLGQSEVGEVRAGEGGGSSTLPQKSNPVAAEALVTLARLNAADLGGLAQAMAHAQERDGSALGLEWSLAPAMIERAGAAFALALPLARTLAPRRDAIAATFAKDRGAMLAETAARALAQGRPRAQAQALIAEALAGLDADPDATLAGALSRLAPERDWTALLDIRAALGEAPDVARKQGA